MSGGRRSFQYVQRWGRLNRVEEKYRVVSIDDLSAEQKDIVTQYLFWTAVAVVAGYVVLVVL